MIMHLVQWPTARWGGVVIRSGGSFPKSYMIAADQGPASLAAITGAIASTLGSGKTVPMNKTQV
jgi:hypothetical protein